MSSLMDVHSHKDTLLLDISSNRLERGNNIKLTLQTFWNEAHCVCTIMFKLLGNPKEAITLGDVRIRHSIDYIALIPVIICK